ncbi:MAG: tRNA glutamyl-Q(34) synthetase GluQRS [Burkholderiaceae bacterium]
MAGRFAPSPTGPLHLGSLVTALASYLDARAHFMPWLLRMEDLDPPREAPGAANEIKQQLLAHGLNWDVWPSNKGGREDGILYQSDHAGEKGPYAQALQRLLQKEMAFRCQCSRSTLQEFFNREGAPPGSTNLDGEKPYPGLCRERRLNQGRAWRFKSPEAMAGHGEDDFILQRADGLWAYHLAVVVDDHFQGISRIVRGEDLASMQPKHGWLQDALELPQPSYQHVPLVVNDQGQKLSKQTQAKALLTDERNVGLQLKEASTHLKRTMPAQWLERVSPAAKSMGLSWG